MLIVEIIAFGYEESFSILFFFLCNWRITSATDVSYQGGCSRVQDVSGISSEVIGPLGFLSF